MRIYLNCIFTILFFIGSHTFLFTQTQLGLDIDGEASSDASGFSVSISTDGSRVAVGGHLNDSNGSNSGHARIYELSNGNWIQLGGDIDGEAMDDYFGISVSLSGNGAKVAIGAPHADGDGNDVGHVQIYELNNGIWTQIGSDIDGGANGLEFGYSVSLSTDGNRVAIGDRFNNGIGNSTGHVQVFEFENGNWNQLGGNINGENIGDLFGISVSLSGDGNRVAIGGPLNDGNGDNSGHVRILEFSNGNWTQLGVDIDGEAITDLFGGAVSLSEDGGKVAIGASNNDDNGSNSGHVRIYEFNGGSWIQLGTDINGEAIEDFSGRSVSLSDNGNQVAIGASGNDGNGNNSGHVRIYEFNGGTWTQLGIDINGEMGTDASGHSVSLSGNSNQVAIGAPNNNGSGSFSGHVRVYENLEPLPIELIYFSGVENYNSVILNWSTGLESNNYGFEIEHSVNAKNWKKINFKKGKRNSYEIEKYKYIHKEPNNGINYYRLKQIDFNENFEYSPIITVRLKKRYDVEIFPNPTKGNVTISGIENSKIVVINNLGKVIKVITSSEEREINFSDFPRGIYYILIEQSGRFIAKKIIKE